MFYDRFLNLCAKVGVKPAQVRKALGISQSTMASWKSKGLTPRYETLKRIAAVLGVPVEFLLDPAMFSTDSDLIPLEFNEFERFIETFGYYTRLEGDHYSIRHENDSVEITPDELKKLVRSSRKTVAALIEAMMEEARDNKAPAIETPPEAPDGPPEAK